MKRAFFAFVLLIALAAPAFAVLPQEKLDDPRLEERARAISRDVRCQVCQNQSIDDSNAPLAADLRRLVRERLKAGDSDQQVFDYLTQRYGDYVLLRPPVRGDTALLWYGPAAVLAIAALGIGLHFRRRRAGADATPPLAPEEEERLARILGEGRDAR
jgi:cytochrome c-type biogenesis protein CcmH